MFNGDGESGVAVMRMEEGLDTGPIAMAERVPIGADIGSDDYVLLDRVLFAIEPAKQLRLIILDACRDNPFAKTMKRTVASRGRFKAARALAKPKPWISPKKNAITQRPR